MKPDMLDEIICLYMKEKKTNYILSPQKVEMYRIFGVHIEQDKIRQDR